ncbi:MAG: SDR family oxidoreductase [Bacilli bacterium]|nr:SDR family oxidoreductase [Bacilli bacterium]
MKNRYFIFDLDESDYGCDCKKYKIEFPQQHQNKQPGLEHIMEPRPIFDNKNYCAAGKLKGKVAIITGGDSGIGRAVALSYAKEGAKVAIIYFNEHQDAVETKEYIENIGGEVLLIATDLKVRHNCEEAIKKVVERYGKIDILVNNAGVQFQQKGLLDISDEQFDFTLKSNVYSMFYMTRFALKYMECGASIINLSSITAFKGNPELIDYVTSKAAIVGFTRSLATNLAMKNIRVNAVAPGIFWTPLQPACWEATKIPKLAVDVPMGRAGQTNEIAPLFVFLASNDSSFVTGQVIHINGGEYKG